MLMPTVNMDLCALDYIKILLIFLSYCLSIGIKSLVKCVENFYPEGFLSLFLVVTAVLT